MYYNTVNSISSKRDLNYLYVHIFIFICLICILSSFQYDIKNTYINRCTIISFNINCFILFIFINKDIVKVVKNTFLRHFILDKMKFFRVVL